MNVHIGGHDPLLCRDGLSVAIFCINVPALVLLGVISTNGTTFARFGIKYLIGLYLFYTFGNVMHRIVAFMPFIHDY